MGDPIEKTNKSRFLVPIILAMLGACILILGLVAVVVLVLIPAFRENKTTSNQLLIDPDRAAELSARDGTTLSIPAGAFREAVTVTLEMRADGEFPRVTEMYELVSPVYELNRGGFADQSQPLTLTIQTDPALLPEGAPVHALTAVWWDGETWREIPSSANADGTMVNAQIHHFSDLAAAISRFKTLAYNEHGAVRTCYFNETFVHDKFTIHYTSRPPEAQKECLSSEPASTPDDRPPEADSNGDGVPDYLEQLGAFLATSREAYDGGGEFDRVAIYVEETIHIFVLHKDVAGELHPETGHISVDARLEELSTTAAHELFHYWQITVLPREVMEKNAWWREATAVWAEDEIFDEVNDYTWLISQYAPDPPEKGFAELPLRDFGEFYAAVTFVKYLESIAEGFVLDTFNPESGLSYGEPWYLTFDRILREQYSLEFNDVLPDYFASYFYFWDYDEDIPLWFDSVRETKLAYQTNIVEPGDWGQYELYIGGLRPLAGALIHLKADNNLTQATLVVRQRDGWPTVIVPFADQVSGDIHTALELPEAYDLGLMIIEGFGGAQIGEPVNEVYLVVVNMDARKAIYPDFEYYALTPPIGLHIVDQEADPLVFKWEPHELHPVPPKASSS